MNTPHTRHKSKSKKKKYLSWLLEIALVIIILLGVRAWQQHGMVNGEAPEIMLEDLSGKMVNLADYQGKPLLLHFWATWCKFCEFEESWINEIDKDWQVLTIATLSSGTEEEIRHYMQRHNISHWQTIIDKDNSLAEHYGISVMPSTFVIDSQGEIRFKEVGITTPWGWNIRLWLTDLLDG
jgi:peroxiredoxin